MLQRATTRLASITSTVIPAVQARQLPLVQAAPASTATSRSKKKSSAMESSFSPLTGLYKPTTLKALYYGRNTVQEHLLSCLPSSNSKAFIITGSSLATKTPLIKQLEELLQSKSAHAGTFSNIKQHAPVVQLDEATDKVVADSTIDTIISVGGGSPIDSAKAISYRCHEKGNSYLNHIAIPTTLSAAECTFIAGFTQSDGLKTSVADPNLWPSYVLYDSSFALHSPPDLFASTGIRALDHAVEMQYHPTASFMPAQVMGHIAIRELFEFLPKYKANPKDEDIILRLYLAAYASLGFLGANVKGGLGLSHTLGYALGSPYGIPHGITSCLSLGHVVKLKAQMKKEDAAAVARILGTLGGKGSGDDVKDAEEVGDRILKLVEELGFKTSLTEKGVDKDQVDLIVQRCTGGKMDEQTTGKIRELVESLY